MADLQPFMVTRSTAAKLLELTFHEFDRLIQGGILPRGHWLDSHIERWHVDELRQACQRPLSERLQG
ncbi:MAG: hypothetical protein Q7J44_11550 [Pseudotabrizicola sp.]|uniref:hypothetical protein n=1 Tax=Pseudotabrizicola sp. TaxID=2939647 RepID=UPI002715DC31|nr:hypothetical protein [Pseudotabrizicola sp.]MDO9639165.1 hypothetical protein [Pseudotabrizicola sp.]